MKKKIIIWCWIIPALLSLLVLLFVDGNQRLVTTEYNVELASLPAEFDGLRIVQLSDLHGCSFGADNIRLFNRVREAQPDLIAITGDLFDADDELEYVEKLMPGLLDIAPVYYVTGNHEWATGKAEEAMDIMRSIGVHVLQNEAELLERDGASLALCGVDDPNSYADMPSAADVYALSAGADCTVLLAHRNTHLAEYVWAGFDVIFCGHGHGGIVRLPFVGGLVGVDRRLFPDNTEGVEIIDGAVCVISRGLGNVWNIPRLFNNPQIVSVTLRAK